MAEHSSDIDGWEEVAKVGQRYQADLMALRLEGVGIQSQILDASFEQIPHPDTPNFELIRIMVPPDRAAEARRVLNESANLPEDAELASDGEEPPD